MAESLKNIANVVLTLCIPVAMIGFGCLMAGLLQRSMRRSSRNMSRKLKQKVDVHPYMEMMPAMVGQAAGRESEIAPAPDADLSREEPEDRRRA